MRTFRRLATFALSLCFAAAAGAQRPTAFPTLDALTGTAMHPARGPDSVQYRALKQLHDSLLTNHPKQMIDSFWHDLNRRHLAQISTPEGAAEYAAWLDRFRGISKKNLRELAAAVDASANDSIIYRFDDLTYGTPNFYATPLETLRNTTGDCEDYAILKYFTLKDLGVPLDKIRILMVSGENEYTITHAVLLADYGRGKKRDLYVLDNKDVVSLVPWREANYKAYYLLNHKTARFAQQADFTAKRKR